MVIIQGYNFFFLQISFLGHIITIDKYILSTLFTVLLDKIVCVCVCKKWENVGLFNPINIWHVSF